MKSKSKLLERSFFAFILLALLVVTNQYFGFDDHFFPNDQTAEAAPECRAIFSSLDEGDIEVANLLLDNMYTIPRYDPVTINPPINWNEDPFNDRYWRMNYYGLTFTKNLLYAGVQTGDTAYWDKLEEIINSFVDSGMNAPHSWDDLMGAGWRTMVLTNTWLTLQENNALTDELSSNILEALEVHGNFLMDPLNYEEKHNHGIVQAAALLLLGTSFPDMPEAEQWESIAKKRLDTQLITLIDDDGVLVENSPYYHLYALQLYQEIYDFTVQNDINICDDFGEIIDKMRTYVRFILQPDLEVPLLGASIERQLHLSGAYEEMAMSDPYLLYVLTRGEQGKVPQELNKYFSATGQTILRSGWGEDNDFKNETQLIFDIGDYRTNHSDLDALSFSLYSNGISLMPDSGLYTYDGNDPLRSYFHGTSAHNTVVVDGEDQLPFAATQGVFSEGNGYSYQSAQHELYHGVSHERALSLLGHDLVLIVDKLTSDDEHKYEQMFHLFPEAELDVDGLTVTGRGVDPEQSVTIHQLLPEGITVSYGKGAQSTPIGLYSSTYGNTTPNYAISYQQQATTAVFLTLIEIGQPDENLKTDVSPDHETVSIITSSEKYVVGIAESNGTERNITVVNDAKIPSPEEIVTYTFRDADEWIQANNQEDKGAISVVETMETIDGTCLQIESPNDGSYIDAVKDVNLDLSENNILLRMNALNMADVNRLELSFSTENWEGYVTCSLANLYRHEFDGEWLTFNIGKTTVEENHWGGWQERGTGFNWANIDAIRFRIGSLSDTSASLQIDRLSQIAEQEEGSLIITFDDGHESILYAAEVMNKYGIRGNIAAYAKENANSLTPFQLRELQDVYGWNIVSHSGSHKNGVTEYFEKGDMVGLEEDIIAGAQFLIDNGINSAPNWYIYPNGATNAEIKEVISKYYNFARLSQGPPEVLPFAEPLGVRAYSIPDDAPADDVKEWISEAMANKQTYFLTFHRITTSDADRGYDLGKFEEIVKYIADQGIKVMTYSELDQYNGIPANQMTITPAVPAQLMLTVSIL